MAGIAHLGIALAFSILVPDVHILILVICSYLIDIIFLVFMFAGIEQIPTSDRVGKAPWSHSLFMAVIWSVLAAIIAMLFTQNPYTTMIIGLLVFSHWVIDFLVSPMLYAFPNDTGKPLHPFRGSPKVGLGWMKTKRGAMLSEGVPLTLGIIIFVLTLIM